MAEAIDRNAMGMLRYAKGAQEILNEMDLIVNKVEEVLKEYASNLDTPTQVEIEKLSECCKTYRKTMETYKEITKDVSDKGKKLAAVRGENGG